MCQLKTKINELENSEAEQKKSVSKSEIVLKVARKNETIEFANERCETFYDDASKSILSIDTIKNITEHK